MNKSGFSDHEIGVKIYQVIDNLFRRRRVLHFLCEEFRQELALLMWIRMEKYVPIPDTPVEAFLWTIAQNELYDLWKIHKRSMAVTFVEFDESIYYVWEDLPFKEISYE